MIDLAKVPSAEYLVYPWQGTALQSLRSMTLQIEMRVLKSMPFGQHFVPTQYLG